MSCLVTAAYTAAAPRASCALCGAGISGVRAACRAALPMSTTPASVTPGSGCGLRAADGKLLCSHSPRAPAMSGERPLLSPLERAARPPSDCTRGALSWTPVPLLLARPPRLRALVAALDSGAALSPPRHGRVRMASRAYSNSRVQGSSKRNSGAVKAVLSRAWAVVVVVKQGVRESGASAPSSVALPVLRRGCQPHAQAPCWTS